MKKSLSLRGKSLEPKTLHLCAAIVILLLGPVAKGQDNVQPSGVLYDLEKKQALETAQWMAEFARSDVVFLGEEHDNDAGHEMQLAIIRELTNYGAAVTVSMEMFERDVQGAVDDYLAGRIDEQAFLEAARPWPNYDRHYRPVIEWAKEHHMPVLAANVPRAIARQVSQGEPVDPAAEQFLPRSTSAPEDAYWHKFHQVMRGHVGADGADAMQRMYRAQCLKDDAMAESIADHLALVRHRPVLVVHLCGKFHSDDGLGVVQRLLQRRPLVRVAVVTMVATDQPESLDLAAHADRAHFLMAVPPNKETSDNQAEEDAPPPDDQVDNDDRAAQRSEGSGGSLLQVG